FHAPTVERYRNAAEEARHYTSKLPISINPHGFVGASSQQAREIMYPYFAKGMADNNHQRGKGIRIPRAAFEAQASPQAGLIVGSAQEVIDKLLAYHEMHGINRAIIQMGFGGVPQAEHLEAIERLGTEVAPVVRHETQSAEGVAA